MVVAQWVIVRRSARSAGREASGCPQVSRTAHQLAQGRIADGSGRKAVQGGSRGGKDPAHPKLQPRGRDTPPQPHLTGLLSPRRACPVGPVEMISTLARWGRSQCSRTSSSRCRHIPLVSGNVSVCGYRQMLFLSPSLTRPLAWVQASKVANKQRTLRTYVHQHAI